MGRSARALVALAALGSVVLVAGRWEEGSGGHEPPAATSRKAEAAPEPVLLGSRPSATARDASAVPCKAAGDVPPPPALAGAGEVAGATASGGAAVAAGSEPPLEEPRDEPLAVRANPRSLPPAPEPGDAIDFGDHAGPVLTGHWERFAPEPERGPAALTVRVLDAKGAAVAGAGVILGPPGIVGQRGLSYEHLRVLGSTDESGRFADARLPEGRGAVAVEFAHLLLGERGLDALVARAVLLDRKVPMDLTLALPFALAELSGVQGVVRGPDGRPVTDALVSVRFAGVVTDGAGRFAVPHLRPGAARLVVGATGYGDADEAVTLTPGETLTRDVVLAYEEAGAVRLTGELRGPDGEAVPGANVFLGQDFADGGGTTLRSTHADAEGRFVMEGLPDRLRSEATRLVVWADGYPQHNVTWASGLPATTAQLRFPRRLVRLSLTVVDRETGEALSRCAFRALATGAEEPCASFSSRADDGRFEAWVEAGVLRLTIEAPDHATQRVEVDVGPGGGTYEHLAALAPEGAASTEIALTVVLVDPAGQPVPRARVEVLSSPGRTPLARLERPQPDGRYLMPAPSGGRILRVASRGFESHEQPLELAADVPAREVRVVLRPR